MTLAEFVKRYPNLPLEKVMNARGIESKYFQEMVVGQPAFLDGANQLVGSMKPSEYRDVMEVILPDVRKDISNFVGKADQFDDITMLGFSWKSSEK